MQTKPTKGPQGPDSLALSRRDVLAGAAATALVAATPISFAATRSKSKHSAAFTLPSDMPLRRYMSAAAAMQDGRVLIAGGYDSPWTARSKPSALNSVVILSPGSGQWTAAAPMNIPRARHAAVALRDGRIAVIGGMGMSPTASVEIYDPGTNTWQIAESLTQPRYDHTAVTDGYHVYVLGGSSQSISTSVEVFRLESAFPTSPQP